MEAQSTLFDGSTSVAPVSINSIEVQPIVLNGQPVLTLAMIDKIHQRPEGTARRNFRENKARLVNGEDFIVVTRKSSMDEIRTLGTIPPKGVTLLTESGYLLLVKSFTDDLAWKIQKQLVKAYFRAGRPNVLNETLEALTPSEQRTIQELVKYKTANVDSQQRRKAIAEIYSRLNNKFRVAKYSQIARTQLADAIAYIMEMSVKAAAPKQEKLGEVGAYIIQQFSDVMAQYLSKNRAHNIASVLHEEMQRRFGCAVRDVPVSEVGKIVSSIGELCDDTFRVWSLSSLMENWVQMEWEGYRSAMPEGVRYALENIEIPALAKIPEVSIKKRAAMMLGV